MGSLSGLFSFCKQKLEGSRQHVKTFFFKIYSGKKGSLGKTPIGGASALPIDENLPFCLKKIVVYFFVADGSFRPVARIHDCVIRQRKEFGTDRGHKLLVTGEREVCSADGF